MWRGAIVLALGLVLGLVLFLSTRGMRSTMADAQAAPKPAPIDGDRAYRYLKQICALGPRPAGSEANERQRQLVAAHFKQMGAEVREQPFTSRDPRSGQPVAMANLIGSWFPDRTERVVIGAHYDTRPFPDQETDPSQWNQPFLGANDGASGVALLMEIAHHLKQMDTPWGVDLVLFDGEELVYGRNASLDNYFLGSRAFASAYAADRKRGRPKARYVHGIVLDMVGGRDLAITQEPYSLKLHPRLVREIWDIAHRLKEPGFLDRKTWTEVSDDHLPLNAAGIPTIDLIDFDYPHWHKASDRPENCSAASLAQVGRVVTAWLVQPRKR
ncbi:MAG: M28 family peptidase [Isosphaeraceae bacterium]|nr:M28 family peptidase [Isosphaeraceae bacterium]